MELGDDGIGYRFRGPGTLVPLLEGIVPQFPGHTVARPQRGHPWVDARSPRRSDGGGESRSGSGEQDSSMAMERYTSAVFGFLILWLVIGAWRLRKKRSRPGPAAAAMMREILDDERRAAVEIILENERVSVIPRIAMAMVINLFTNPSAGYSRVPHPA